MKFLSISVCLCLCSFYVSSQKTGEKKENDQQYFSESGVPLNVKETRDKNGVLTEKTFTRQTDGGLDNKELYVNGKLSETDYFGSEGKMTFKTKFNDKGQETETIFYESSGEIASRSVYTYDTNGNARTERFRKDGSKESSETHDSDMRVVELTSYKTDGQVSSIEKCKYDGRVTDCKKSECIKSDGKGKLISKQVIDHVAHTREDTRYFASGKPSEIQIKENAYTINEKIKDWTIYEEDGSYRKQKMQRFKLEDGSGLSVPLEVNYYSNKGALVQRVAYKYDAQGKELERKIYDGQGKEIK